MADPDADRSSDADLPPFDARDLAAAERVLALAFDERRREHVPEALERHRRGIAAMRRLRFANELAPASVFEARGPADPLPPPRPPAPVTSGFGRSGRAWDDLPFLTVAELAAALRRGEVTSRALTDRYLARIARHDAALRAVVTPLTERARAEADRADRELAAGIDRGPLHGIPYLAKDLLAVPDAPTTWGAAPFREQRLDATATVVARLAEAGAVLLGKASLGALAMGDVWFDATTRNPWNLEEGSSGSSAGSAAGVAAGLCAFAIGSETMGSILSPAERCSVVGLRPTFGRVSRRGAMALSWSLDKLGPLARSAEDAALVLTAVAGADPDDPATREAPFPWDPDDDPTELRVGAPRAALDDPDPALAACLADLEALGVPVAPLALPDLPTEPIMTLLMVEASAAFDELVRGDGMDALVRQTPDAWPTLLRAARFVPAADYVQAQRLQRRIRDEVAELFGAVDLVLTAGTDAPAMLLGNAAGAPAASLPCGRGEAGRPLGNVALLARPFFEHQALALAQALQRRRGPLAAPPAFAADAAG
jgi:Asp-tRNA(Asn)/Glu-tRNA(Gln) amidotransferase A subunit family amidase